MNSTEHEDSSRGGSALSEGLGAWVPAHERVPAAGTECVVLVRYTLDRLPFCTVDKWDVQREDPTGMGGQTIETGEGWNDNYESDVIAWIAIPPHSQPATVGVERQVRLAARETTGETR